VTLLEAHVVAARDTFHLDATLSAAGGEVVAVVGPNGAGKSTLVRAITGLDPHRGSVRIDGADVSHEPPERRPVAWVPQRVALFPHLTVVDNVAFGVGGRRGRAVAHAWLDRFGLAHLASRRATSLSGGQAQKVALVRALVRRPRVLLLDEPLAALDVAARVDVRRTLREQLAEFDGVTVVVTHDAVDVATVTHRVVAIEAGRIVQDASLQEVARAPRSPWLATMLGANACRGTSRDGGVDVDGGGRLVGTDVPGADGVGVLAVFAPHSVVIHPQRPRGSARNAWPVRVRQLTDVGGRIRVDAEGAPPVVAEVTAAAVADLGLHESAEVWASVKATEVTVVVL
jgi:molybdate transport system permease protein